MWNQNEPADSARDRVEPYSSLTDDDSLTTSHVNRKQHFRVMVLNGLSSPKGRTTHISDT